MAKKKTAKSKTDIELALSASRSIWGSRYYDPNKPVIAKTSSFINSSHVLMMQITHDIDRIALGSCDINPFEDGDFNAFITNKNFEHPSFVGLYAIDTLIEILQYIKAMNCDVISLTSYGTELPLLIESYYTDKEKYKDRHLKSLLAPRVEEKGDDDFGEDELDTHDP